MKTAFGTDFIETKSETVSIIITALETGQRFYSVRGGVKNGIKVKCIGFNSLNECLNEVKERLEYTLRELY